jgi:hypothetical protein
MKGLAATAVAALVVFAPGAVASAQTPCPERDAVTVVHTLLDRDAVVRMPLDRRERVSIAGGDLYPMPGGPSRVLLVGLPNAATPYTLVVRGRSFGALLFSGAFELTRVVPVFDFVGEGLTLRKTPRADAAIPIDPAAGERYLLLYGRGLPGIVDLQIAAAGRK